MNVDIEEYFHELLNHAQAVADMASSAGWTHLNTACNKALYATGELILSGQITDREEYIRRTAFREGMLYVLDTPNRLNRDAQRARDQVAELHPD